MDRRYDTYCAADPIFYDSLTGSGRTTADFEVAGRALPNGWRREEHDDWLIVGPADQQLPRQGWKIHVSGCQDNAEYILDTVWTYCTARGISFKFLRSPRVHLMRNSKYAPRASSGKLMTIYPLDEPALRTGLAELDALLHGAAGPYILSDLRYANGPLYVRYGGFAHLYCVADNGGLVPALVDPDGNLVPDRREAVFRLPPWVSLPPFLQPHLDARNATTVGDLPYRVERVLHYSNGGGLYEAVDVRTGTRVVLKEARPYAGLDGHGDDAVTRLRRERDMLQRVATADVTPLVRDSFLLGEHEFIVLEYIDGVPLNKLIVQRYPLTELEPSDAAVAEYTAWARAICDRVELAVRALHERGVVYGDLHMFNVMVRDAAADGDSRVTLLDFEVAASVDETRRPGLRNQGFAAPRDRVGTEVDEYALACLRLAVFLPLTPLLRLRPDKARHFAEVIAAHFPVDRDWLDDAVEVIDRSGPLARHDGARTEYDLSTAFDLSTASGTDGALAGDSAGGPAGGFAGGSAGGSVAGIEPPGWPRLRDALHRAILASATPDREDRLFPGDIEQFRLGAVGIGYGAAGVLYALAQAGLPVEPAHLNWLAQRATNPAFDTRHGFLDGLHGAAYVLDLLGRRQDALDVVEASLPKGWEGLGNDLAGGVCGIGLHLLHLAERAGEPELHKAGMRAVDIVADRLGEADSVAQQSGGDQPYAGLTHGSSGPALLFLRAYDLTGDAGYLDLAATALRQDLRRCVTRADGALEVNEGWRTMPYLAQGSVGIGLVLDEYLARRDDVQFAEASRAAALAATSPMYVQSGLFAGRAGIVAYLGTRRRRYDHPASRALDAQLRRLAWHALPYGGGLAFPGEQLLRLSMDLATGTAGVLLAVAIAVRDAPVSLPLLLPRPARPAPGTTDHHANPRGQASISARR